MQEFGVYLFIGESYVRCAQLTVTEQGYELQYEKDYLELEAAVPIDPQNLPLYAGPFKSEELFGALRDSAPDYWGRELLHRKFQVAELSELEYVFASGLEHVGALAYSPLKFDQPKRLTPRGWRDPHSEPVVIEQIIEQTEILVKDWDGEKLKELFEYGPTLGGGKPKVNMQVHGQLYLAKYGTSLDTIPEQRIEYATMKMAKDLGLHVTHMELAQHAGRDVFLLKRFDRHVKEKKVFRRHFVSALSLCQWHEFGSSEWSYPVFCEFIRKSGFNETQIQEDLAELFKRIAFNIAVNNNDDHPRNHGLLCDESKQWRLSPLYDVVPKATVGGVFTLAMVVGRYEKEASKRNLLSSHSYFELDFHQAEQIIDEVNDFVQTHWRESFKSAGISDTVIQTFANAMKVKL